MNTINKHFTFGEHSGIQGGDEYTQEEWLDIILKIKEEVKQKDEENAKLKEKLKSLTCIYKEYCKLDKVNEKQIKEMKPTIEMVKVLKKDEKMMKQMKERFIQLKIEEAKMKKNVGNTQEGETLWDLLPPEVEKKIMYRKKSRDHMIGVGDICMKPYFPRYAKKKDEKTLGFYKIIGETKNDWKVEKITHTTEELKYRKGGGFYELTKIPRAEEEQELTKHKHVSKKSGGLQIVRDRKDCKTLTQHRVYDLDLIKAEEDEMFWVY
tara:strand:+ start:13784 stop:14578 length:795 start_codon:yes stop_codon:yes gene_type:complete